MRLLFYMLIASILCSKGFSHPVHVSVTNIEIDHEKQKMSVSVHLFTDDFEKVLQQNYGDSIRIYQNPISVNESLLIENYVNQNLIVWHDIDTLKLNIIDHKEEGQANFYFFEAECGKDFDAISIKNTLMLQLFHDQTNLVIIGNGDSQKGVKFTVQQLKMEISL